MMPTELMVAVDLPGEGRWQAATGEQCRHSAVDLPGEGRWRAATGEQCRHSAVDLPGEGRWQAATGEQCRHSAVDLPGEGRWQAATGEQCRHSARQLKDNAGLAGYAQYCCSIIIPIYWLFNIFFRNFFNVDTDDPSNDLGRSWKSPDFWHLNFFNLPPALTLCMHDHPPTCPPIRTAGKTNEISQLQHRLTYTWITVKFRIFVYLTHTDKI